MVKCPFCGFEGGLAQFQLKKQWKYGVYTVMRLQCPRCGNDFNLYTPTKPGRREFTIPKPKTAETSEGSLHGELKAMVKDIGEALGFKVEVEYTIDNFRVDLAFFRPPMQPPYAVVEVHVGGDVYKDLAALKHVRDRFGEGVRLIYVVARDEDKVLKLVDEALEGAFHEIKNLIILKADMVKELHKVLSIKQVKELLRKLNAI